MVNKININKIYKKSLIAIIIISIVIIIEQNKIIKNKRPKKTKIATPQSLIARKLKWISQTKHPIIIKWIKYILIKK